MSEVKGNNNGILCIDQRALLRTMVESVPDHIYFKDSKSRFILISNSMLETLGIEKPEDAYGKTDFDFFAKEHAQQAFDDEQRIIETGESIVGLEEKETWPDGSITWVTTTKVPLKNDSGEIVGTFGISRDITDLKRGEEAIHEAEQKRVMLESFGTACHHMGQPATVILGHIQILATKMDQFDDDTKSVIEQISQSAEELGKILHKLNEINEYRPTKYLENSERSRNILEI